MSKILDEARNSGRLARAGDLPRHNPFDGRNFASLARRNVWFQGWDEADAEIREHQEETMSTFDQTGQTVGVQVNIGKREQHLVARLCYLCGAKYDAEDGDARVLCTLCEEETGCRR
jgi:hypothetical protein